MTQLNEDAIEKLTIARLQAHGYEYRYGPDIAPDGYAAERGSFGDVLLLGRTPGSEGWLGFVVGGPISGFVGGLVGGAWAGLRRRGTAKTVA